MIITYLRSSSHNRFDFCEHAYYLEYVLCLDAPAGKSAYIGNIVHKAMELLAKRKLAEQLNLSVVADESGEYPLEILSVDKCLDIGWNQYTKLFKQFEWTDKDFSHCEKSIEKVLTYKNGEFDPRKREIFAVERYFDIKLEHKWAKYEFNLQDQKIEGNLSLKGHIDLILKHNDDVLEIVDYKDGQRKNWNTGKEKNYEDLKEDPQLRLYHYCASKLLNVKQILVTIFYINYGGPYTVHFDENDLFKTEMMIMNRFIQIKKTMMPKRIFPDWKCAKLCHFGKTLDEETGKTLCEKYHNELIELGIEKVTNKYAKLSKLSSYGAGGGSN